MAATPLILAATPLVVPMSLIRMSTSLSRPQAIRGSACTFAKPRCGNGEPGLHTIFVPWG